MDKKIIISQKESQQILKSPFMKAFDIVPYLKTLQEKSNEKLEELIKIVENMLPFINNNNHTLFRKVLTKPMAMKSISFYDREIKNSIDQVLDSFINKSEHDLVKDFTDPLYLKLLNNVFGLNIKDETTFFEDISISTLITEPLLSLRDLKNIQSAFLRLKSIVQTEILNSNSKGLIKDIFESADGLIDEEKTIILILTLIIASKVTTESLICMLYEYTKLEEELQKNMLSKEWLNENVDHLIRFCASTKYLTRIATKTVTIGNLNIKDGEQVVIDVQKANRDSSFYGEEDEFNKYPTSNHPHISFGGGNHICPGLHLAKVVILNTIPKFFNRVSLLEYKKEKIIYSKSTFAKRAISAPALLSAKINFKS